MTETPNVVIMNDTRADLHHGCSRVMRVLEHGLGQRGLAITGRSPLRHDWANDAQLLAKMRAARLIIINGEGTLHHGARHGQALLEVVDHPAVAGVPVALINALYQDNPPEWGKWLSRMSLIRARDSRSAAQMSQAMGCAPVGWVPDFTLAERVSTADQPTTDILWGDSVKPQITAILADHARSRSEPLCPSLQQLKRPKGSNQFSRALRQLWVNLHTRWYHQRYPTLSLATSEDQYARIVALAKLHVTGRFHGVCYSMAAGRPFIALDSNSWKSEALIADAGLAPWRLCPPDGLDDMLARQPDALAFSPSEQLALAAYLDMAAAGASALLDDLSRISREYGQI